MHTLLPILAAAVLLAASPTGCKRDTQDKAVPSPALDEPAPEPAPPEPARALIIGHRGASHDAPENTLAAIELAFAQGADGVEFDVHVSADDKVVVIHDDNTKRTAGVDKAVAEQTLEELRKLDVGSWKDKKFAGEGIATLDQALRAVPPTKTALVEIKSSPDTVPIVVAAIEAVPERQKETAIISFDFKTVAESKQRLPEHRVYWVVGSQWDEETKTYPPYPDKIIRWATDAKLTGLAVDQRALSPDFVEKVHRAGLELVVWTVDDAERVRELASAGIDMIESNQPAMAIDALTATD